MKNNNHEQSPNESIEDVELLTYLLDHADEESVDSQTIPRRRDRSKAPLSFSQARLWFLDQLEPDSSVYNIPASVRLSGPLDVPALEKSLNEIIKRHEVLRTTFENVDGHPVQIISSHLTLNLAVSDLSDIPEDKKEAEFLRLARAESRKAFVLHTLPLLRASLVRLNQSEHFLLLSIHHILSDGWSLGIFFRELMALYEAFSAGKESPLPELPIQYTDFAEWQRDLLQGEALDSRLSYWKKQLADLQVLELPLDQSRPPIQTYRGDKFAIKLSKELTQALANLCRQEGVTSFMLLLTAFQVLLARWSGQDDIVTGSPVANRIREEVEGLIGFFVNTLVFRTKIAGNPSFRELLSKVRDQSLSAFEHQDLPFEKLVEELHPERDISRSPLFQVMFILQNTPWRSLSAGELAISPVQIPNDITRFDLTLTMVENADGLSGVFEYNVDLFDAGTIERMAAHFENILVAVTADPNQHIAQLPILTESEKHKLLTEWTATEKSYLDDKCLHILFEDQVEKKADEVAVRTTKTSLTYLELNARANQLAHYLADSGVEHGSLIGICMERATDMLVSTLAVMKAGAAYVPLDPSYPDDRLSYMISDAQLKVILSQSSVCEQLQLEDKNVNFICLDRDSEAIDRESTENPDIQVTPSSLVYVIYTSGSTGKPKGVQIAHRSLVNFLTAMAEEPGFCEKDVLLAVTTLSFDISGLELYLPLITGGEVIIASRETVSDGKLLSLEIANSGATVMQATPATWQMLLDAGWQGKQELRIFCGGEALPGELANRLVERSAEVWNMYGPTETTIWSSVCRVKGDGRFVPIGGPIANTQFYILDSYLNPVPVGVYGDLYIGGDGLARGYLNRPGLTAEKFIPDPFTSGDGARLYGTGDVARYLPDGSIEFVGRRDNQVKLRGFRIELGEIEATLFNHSAIDAAIALIKETEGGKRLVAYLISKEHTPPTISDMRRFLLKTLPEYMVPTAFVFLDEFPLTPNRKVDRLRLPDPDGARPDLESAFVPPQNEVERTISEVWREALNVKQVGVEDNFFDLGGHSLLLVQVQSRLQNIFERELSIVELFKYPSIKMLARFLSDDEDNHENHFQQIKDRAKRQKDALARQKQF